MKIGFIGLGIMGSRMASNLQKNYNKLFLYNRTEEKALDLINNGAIFKETPEDVASEANIIFTSLSTPEVVKEVALGKNGFLPAMKENSLWVDVSTVNPSFSKNMAKIAKTYKVRFIDAPVGGSKKPAEEGHLIFFAGGKEEDILEVKPLLELMGKKIIHTGPNGMGSSLKMVVNLLLGQAMLSFSEAVRLGKSLGLSEEFLLDSLPGSPVVAPFVSHKVEKLKNNDYEEEFPLELLYKDLCLAILTARENNISLMSANTAKEIYGGAKSKGLGREDFSAIYKFF